MDQRVVQSLISADGQTVFLNLYTQNTVRKLDRETDKHLGDVMVEHPDNSSWMSDDRLLVASHPNEGMIPDICREAASAAETERIP